MTLQVQPDWTRIGTATELEAYMGDNFLITGCGLYLSNTDTILVLGSSTTKWRDITGKLSLYVWNCPLNETVLGITIPTAQDNRQ